jgi:hypothetical protein
LMEAIGHGSRLSLEHGHHALAAGCADRN